MTDHVSIKHHRKEERVLDVSVVNRSVLSLEVTWTLMGQWACSKKRICAKLKTNFKKQTPITRHWQLYSLKLMFSLIMCIGQCRWRVVSQIVTYIKLTYTQLGIQVGNAHPILCTQRRNVWGIYLFDKTGIHIHGLATLSHSQPPTCGIAQCILWRNTSLQ